MNGKTPPLRKKGLQTEHEGAFPRNRLAIRASIVVPPPIGRRDELDRRVTAVTISIVPKHRLRISRASSYLHASITAFTSFSSRNGWIGSDISEAARRRAFDGSMATS